MSRRLMLQSAAKTIIDRAYIAEATYNENCYVDANHVMHINVAAYQTNRSPYMALSNTLSVVTGDSLSFVGSQSFRNFVTMLFYRNGNLVYKWTNIFLNNVVINKSASSPFTGEFDAIAVLFGGGGSGMSALNIRATKNGEEWLN